MKIDDALQYTAEVFHSTPEAILNEIQAALDEAFATPDSDVQEAWSHIPYTGDRPDAREVLPLLAAMLETPETSPSVH